MTFDEFCERLGLAIRSKGWLIKEDGSDYPDTSMFKVYGPCVDENANLVYCVIIPDELEGKI